MVKEKGESSQGLQVFFVVLSLRSKHVYQNIWSKTSRHGAETSMEKRKREIKDGGQKKKASSPLPIDP